MVSRFVHTFGFYIVTLAVGVALFFIILAVTGRTAYGIVAALVFVIVAGYLVRKIDYRLALRYGLWEPVNPKHMLIADVIDVVFSLLWLFLI